MRRRSRRVRPVAALGGCTVTARGDIHLAVGALAVTMDPDDGSDMSAIEALRRLCHDGSILSGPLKMSQNTMWARTGQISAQRNTDHADGSYAI